MPNRKQVAKVKKKSSVQNHQKREHYHAESDDQRMYEQQIRKMERIIQEKDHHINELHAQIEEYERSTTWRITEPLRKMGRVSRTVMRTPKKAVGKAKSLIRAYKADGFHGVYVLTRQFFLRRKHNAEMVSTCNEMGMSVDNLTGFIPYDSRYEENQSFAGKKTDVRMLAFYLPQFHTFPENDKWWGKGFTEWNNTRKCTQPRFEGHYQPRTPHRDIGFYDLSDINVMRKQAELARAHGIYGFCFYYYWFSGKRLMERPVDQLLEHPEIDLPFCLCWANENWTRAWDGLNRDILIKQAYSEEDDESFICDIKKYFDDERYIRIDGKPVVVVYNPGQIPSCKKSFAKWRQIAQKIGVGDILIWTCATSNNSVKELHLEDCVDAEVEFPPHNMWYEQIGVRGLDLSGKSAMIYNYQNLVKIQEKQLKEDGGEYPVPIHHACTMGWDNSARRAENWFTLYAFSLKYLYRWTRAIMDRARKDFREEERYVFINAWNEWAEGTYLEPDERYGYANINTVSKALFDMPFENEMKVFKDTSRELTNEEFEHENDMTARIAVHAHVFYIETLDEILRNIKLIPYRYDCYFSTDTKEKKKLIEKKCKNVQLNGKCQVEIFENRGRDVAPFIEQLRPVIRNYKYVCHIHSKKTKWADYGDAWRAFNFRNLFGSTAYLRKLFCYLEESPHVGIVFPDAYPAIKFQVEWGGNYDNCKAILKNCGCQADLPADPVFPVGNMFWAKTKAIAPLFDGSIQMIDFPQEEGQINLTIAHAIERSWVYVAQSQRYDYTRIVNACTENSRGKSMCKRLTIYAHYSVNNVISDEDVEMLQKLKDVSSKVFFVTNNNCLAERERKKVNQIADYVMIRENRGYDFAAWRDALLRIGQIELGQYDEVVLTNNSITGPYYSLGSMFDEMTSRNVDFWGIMLYPFSPDGSYIHRDCIPEHLQSYFTVYTSKVIKSEVFWNFWKELKDYSQLIDVIANCETQMTNILKMAGFSYDAYLKESVYLNNWLRCGDVPYEYPADLLILGMPFVKKKASHYMNDFENIRLRQLITALQDNNS